MSNGWDSYVWQLQNRYSAKKQQFTVTGVCEHAAIYGIDGTCWAHTSAWPGLKEYEHPLEQDDGSFTNIHVNEFKGAMMCSKGNRNPTAAGIRMGNIKFMMIRNDPETNVSYLSRMGGGGACIAQSKNALIITIWDKNALMSNNQNQNAGDANELAEVCREKLIKEGY